MYIEKYSCMNNCKMLKSNFECENKNIKTYIASSDLQYTSVGDIRSTGHFILFGHPWSLAQTNLLLPGISTCEESNKYN